MEEAHYAQTIVDTVREPFVVLDQNLILLSASEGFFQVFKLDKSTSLKKPVFEPGDGRLDVPPLRHLLENFIQKKDSFRDYEISSKFNGLGTKTFLVNGREIASGGVEKNLIVLSFEDISRKKKNSIMEKNRKESLQNILALAPAAMCTLRGPDHIFELVNEKYLQLIGSRDVIGRPVRQVLPEAEHQGFLEILDRVYESAQPFIGKEIPLDLVVDGEVKTTILDFIYQPIVNSDGESTGIFAHAVDVTEKVRARKEIEESESNLKRILDTVPVIIWMTNGEGELEFLSENWFKYTGRQKREDAVGNEDWLEAIHPEDRKDLGKILKKAHEERSSYNITYRMKLRDGSFRWVLGSGRPKFLPSGEYDGLIGTVVDVHEEKEKERLLRDKEHRIRTMVEEATVPTAVYTGKEKYIELANDAMLAVWGKDRSVVGMKLKDALPELEGQPFHDLLEEVYETGQTYWGKEDKVDLVVNNQLRSGYFNFTYKPLRNEKGEIYGIMNMALDVTEMVESRNLIRESENHFRLMADLMPEKVSNTDPEGNFIYFNQNWLDYTGLDSAELKEMGWSQFVHPEERQDYLAEWQRCLTSGDNFEMELRLKDKKGAYNWHLNRAEAVRAEDGRIKLWIGTNTEIQRLKEEEKRKEDFLKMVSHELKTPVTSIKGYVQLLLTLTKNANENKLSALPLKPSLERIDHQILRLTRLISEMLDLSRLEENKLELQKEVFNLNDLVDQTVQDINYTNTHHKIIVCHECNCYVDADKDRIGQVLINFITNAIKYSPQSQNIQVKVSEIEDDEVEVCVMDKGIGIDPSNQKNIFRRFYRIHGENDDTYAGFGIGLYLAKEIIERHDGSINVKSKLGQGSEFSFKISVVKTHKKGETKDERKSEYPCS